MPRETSLKQDAVYAAIRGLIADGLAPITSRLRAKLEGRGSPIVLQRFIDDWFRDEAPDVLLGKPPADRPPSTHVLRDELLHLTEEANRRIEAREQESLADLQRRAEDLDDRSGALDAREDDLLERENRLNIRELDLAELMSRLRSDADAADARAKAADAVMNIHIESAAKAQNKLNEVREQLARAEVELAAIPALQASLHRLREDVEREQKRVLDLTGERDRARTEAAARDADLRVVRGQVEALQGQLSEVRVNLAAARAELEASSARAEGAERALAMAGDSQKELVKTFQAAAESAADREATLRADIAAHERKHGELLARHEVAIAEASRLEGARAQLVDRVRSLEEQPSAVTRRDGD